MNRSTITFLIAAVLLVLAVAGCYAARPEQPGGYKTLGDGVWRYEDPDYRVICWESKHGYSGGIFCLPESQVQPR